VLLSAWCDRFMAASLLLGSRTGAFGSFFGRFLSSVCVPSCSQSISPSLSSCLHFKAISWRSRSATSVHRSAFYNLLLTSTTSSLVRVWASLLLICNNGFIPLNHGGVGACRYYLEKAQCTVMLRCKGSR
jgi:hypothetical protein